MNLINKKYIIIFVSGVFIVALVVLIYIFFQQKETVTVDNVFDDGFKPNSETIILNTAKGPVNINNVFKGSKKFSDEIQSSYVLSEGIEYAAGGGVNQFMITASNDTGDIFNKENELLSKLGVGKDTACAIPVTEYVTNKDGEVVYYRSNFTFCK